MGMRMLRLAIPALGALLLLHTLPSFGDHFSIQEFNHPSNDQLEQRIAELEKTIRQSLKRKSYAAGKSDSNSLPPCDQLMQKENSPYADGDFITRYTTPYTWTPRADGSRQFDLASFCSLKRYTAQQARQCLQDKHVNFIGDSLTRYHFLSLSYFLHKGRYPPRFNRQQPCKHLDENSQPACTPQNESNICIEGEFITNSPFGESWPWFHASLGGWQDGGVFDGHMECNCARGNAIQCQGNCEVDNLLYSNSRLILSFFKEDGWGDNPRPLSGWNFTECAFSGTCRRDKNTSAYFIERAKNMDYDWRQDLVEALGQGGILRELLPIVNITIYNRGLWGTLKKDRANQIMPRLHEWVKADSGGQCFFRSTTGCTRSSKTAEAEKMNVREETYKAGCSYLDFAHVTADFAAMRNAGETDTIFWDAVHYKPWVYEELNNVMLNVLCNRMPLP